MDTFEKLREVISETLKVPPERVTLSTIDEDIASWDSLGHVNLMIAIEEVFGIFLEVEDFPELSSVPSILGYLSKHGVK
jgi:acyl carrier protein